MNFGREKEKKRDMLGGPAEGEGRRGGDPEEAKIKFFKFKNFIFICLRFFVEV